MSGWPAQSQNESEMALTQKVTMREIGGEADGQTVPKRGKVGKERLFSMFSCMLRLEGFLLRLCRHPELGRGILR